MDPTTEPTDATVANELEQQGDRAPDDATDQQRERGADQATSTSGGAG